MHSVYFQSLNAILVIALLLVNTPGNAENIDKIVETKNNETAQRDRIDQDRRAAAAAYAEDKAACYQRFAVTDCLNQASSAHRARMSDLKRQEILLNDSRRRRQGVDQLQRSQEKADAESPQTVWAKRGNSLMQDTKRNQRVALRLQRVQSAQTRQKDAISKQAKYVKKSQKRRVKSAKAAVAAQRSAAKFSQAQAHRDQVLLKRQSTQKLAAPLQIPQ